jgi:hypothetical protein
MRARSGSIRDRCYAGKLVRLEGGAIAACLSCAGAWSKHSHRRQQNDHDTKACGPGMRVEGRLIESQ